jgi:hypothetical protein
MLKVKERKERYLDRHEFFRGDPEEIGGKNAPKRSPGSGDPELVDWVV